jgi:hypothetical protein
VLAEFRLAVGTDPTRPGLEPQPMGHFKGIFHRTEEYQNYVRFHEAWPVADTDTRTPPPEWASRWEGLPEPVVARHTNWYLGKTLGAIFPWLLADNPATVLAFGTGTKPVMLLKRIGRGKVVVVGDSAFALNKNLEVESGQAFEGLRENPHFWRWLLSILRRDEAWTPPRPVPEGTEGERP